MHRTLLATAAICLAGPAFAQAEVEALYEALRLDEVVEIMRDEGVAAAEDLSRNLFPGASEAGWVREAGRIYDTDRMEDAVTETFAATLDPQVIPELLDFFTTSPGREIVGHEIEARRALADPEVEAAAQEAAREAPASRQTRIERFIEANGLLERNISGALNSNYAFFRGLADGGGTLAPMTEDEIIADVYSSEPEIRQTTIDWLDAFLTLSYAPLSDADLDAYIDLSESEAGRALNGALFEAFDTLYDEISYDLGRSAAAFMQGQDL